MKKICVLVISLVMLVAPCLFAETKPVKIGVIQLSASYAVEIEEAFHKTITSMGYQEGKNLTYIKKIGKAEKTQYDVNRNIAKDLLAKDLDILVTIGTGASTPIWPLVKGHQKTQQVFIGVTYPIQSGLVKQTGLPSGENITGVSYGVSPEVRLKIFRTLFPDKTRFKNAAFVYSSILEQELFYMEDLKKLEKTYDFSLKFIDFYNPNSKQTDFALAKKSITSQEVNLVFGWYSLDAFFKQSQQSRQYFLDLPLPIMAITSDFTDAGAIGGILTNHFQLGAQGAELVMKILSGIPASQLPTEEPREYLLEINLKKAKALNIVIPEAAIKMAYRLVQ